MTYFPVSESRKDNITWFSADNAVTAELEKALHVWPNGFHALVYVLNGAESPVNAEETNAIGAILVKSCTSPLSPEIINTKLMILWRF